MRMLVARAEMESPVRNVIELATVTMIREVVNPTFPTIHPKRRYMTTPMMVRMLGVKTPWKVPKP